MENLRANVDELEPADWHETRCLCHFCQMRIALFPSCGHRWSRATQHKEIVMFAKLSLGQTLVSGIGALLISTVFVLSAVSATDVRIDHAGPRAAMLSYA
jgi:hypothetical protein